MARTKKTRRSCSLGTSQDTENTPKESESLIVQKSPILVCRQRTSTSRAQVKSKDNGRSISGNQAVPASCPAGSNIINDDIDETLSISRDSPLNLAWNSSMKENFRHPANAPEFRPVTPDNLLIPVSEIFSPPTQKQIRSTIRALFPNGPPPPAPVRPMRRPKKGDKYGITSASNCDADEPEECTPKRARRGPPGSGIVSKSAFNSNTNEISERLKLYETIDRLNSSMKENFRHPANAPEFRPVTPDNLLIPVSEIFSPPTQKQIRSTIRALFPNGPPPPAPVRPMRRPKKGDKYGITSASNCDADEPEECTPKRARRGPPGSGIVSKSAFNSNTNEISERLKLYETIDRLVGRTPKEQPVGYMTKRSFSPLPSTSTDNETIMKNDKYFSESLDCDNFYIDDDDELPEVIWDSNNIKKEKDGTGLSSLGCKDIKKEKIDIEINEDMNNNNDDVIAIDDDFCEIDFDKLMPKEKILYYSEVEPKKEPNDKKSKMDDFFPLQPKNQLPTTSGDRFPAASTTVYCVEDFSTTNLLNTDTVLRASNKIASATDTRQSDLVIEVPDDIEPINMLRQAPARPPAWTEEVQFVSEERIDRPNTSKKGNIDVQIVSETPNQHLNPAADLVNELQQFLNCLTGLTAQYCKRKTKKKSKRTKSKENSGPSRDNTSLVVNDENTAPINIGNASVCNVNVPSVTQVQTSDSNSVIPSTNSSPSKRLGECPICLENLPSGSIASTNCGHVFCLECIKQSLKTSGKRCPTCRKQLRGTGYHQVFM